MKIFSKVLNKSFVKLQKRNINYPEFVKIYEGNINLNFKLVPEMVYKMSKIQYQLILK